MEVHDFKILQKGSDPLPRKASVNCLVDFNDFTDQPENTSKATANYTSFHPFFHKHTNSLWRYIYIFFPTQTYIYMYICKT